MLLARIDVELGAEVSAVRPGPLIGTRLLTVMMNVVVSSILDSCPETLACSVGIGVARSRAGRLDVRSAFPVALC